MSQTNKSVPMLKVRQRTSAQSKVATGANVEIFLDDKKLNNISFLKIDLKAAKVAKVTMEMYVQLDVDLPINEMIEQKIASVEGYTMDGKPLAIKTIGNYEPIGIAIKLPLEKPVKE